MSGRPRSRAVGIKFRADVCARARYPWFAKLIFFLFSFICMIVLLNLLIAIMGETYGRILEDGVEDDWRMEQAGVIVGIENDMSEQERGDPELFPKWVHVLEPSDSKDEDDSDVLVEKLQEMLADVRNMVHFHMKAAKKMQKQFDAKIGVLVEETVRALPDRLPHSLVAVQAAANVCADVCQRTHASPAGKNARNA